MTSQSPADDKPTEAYRDAWTAIQYLVQFEGASWSGRERNCVYLNLGNREFANISASSGADFLDDARCAITMDWDGDGRRDLCVKGRTGPRLRILRNRSEGSGHFLSLRLRSRGPNPDAIGARVDVELGDRRIRRRVYAGTGFLAQGSKVLHFGLGDHAGPVTLHVHWPDGSRETLENVTVDRNALLVQGESSLRDTVTPRASGLEVLPVEAPKQGVRRVVLADKLPLAPLPLPSFDNGQRRLTEFAGRPVLVNIWATWCQGCRVELAEFEERAAELAASGLAIVPMTSDEGAAAIAKAKKVIADRGLAEHAGYADGPFLSALDVILIEVLGRHDDLPMPTSLLFDGAGQLVTVYLGPPGVDRILEDVATVKTMNPRVASCARLSDGRWLSRPERDFGTLSQVFQQLGRPALAAFLAEHARARAQAKQPR